MRGTKSATCAPTAAATTRPGCRSAASWKSISTTPPSPAASTRSRPDWDLFSAVEREYYPVYPAGGTPFIPAVRLGERLGRSDLWIKNDGLLPAARSKTGLPSLSSPKRPGSAKRPSSTASTGNAASSLAAVCAAAGRKAVIFVPRVGAPGQACPDAHLRGARHPGARQL